MARPALLTRVSLLEALYDGHMPTVTLDAVQAALAGVDDPEIRRPITELGMVSDVQIGPDGAVDVEVLLTIAGCPMKDTLTRDVTAALTAVDGVAGVTVRLGVMSEEQRRGLREQLRGGVAEPVIPFAEAGSLTRVYAVASGKGGVGKSSVTVNLAAAMAADGLRVGVVDADVYGFSVPRMLGVEHRPTQVDDMILPPIAHEVKVISIGMFVPGNQPVVWRGPMLHRALQQFLADVFWGDLDVLLLDLPPGTGDIAISVAQLVPGAEILVVTTPQQAASEVAERAGAIALQTHQQIVGVVENMSWLEQTDGSRLELFGAGGGQAVADSLTRSVGAPVPLLGQVPIDVRVREGGDSGVPIVLSHPDSAAAVVLRGVSRQLSHRARGLAGRSLGLSPISH
jgi:ATP-binding protein involved in chromosome partitioning